MWAFLEHWPVHGVLSLPLVPPGLVPPLPLCRCGFATRRSDFPRLPRRRGLMGKCAGPLKCAVGSGAALTLAVLALVLRAIVRNDTEPNRCHMTYLLPYFKRVDVDVDADRHLHKYSLYMYVELSGRDAVATDTQPVIYVPGNAGHYKQVRSLGGHATRAFRGFDAALHFYTIDFLEELSAAHAHIAVDQALFLNYCLRTIRGAHGARASVIVVAHSMGGVISRTAPFLRNYPPQSIATLVTLSSPHRGLPVATDRSLVQFYRRVDALWAAHPKALSNVTLLSVSGGLRDNQVGVRGLDAGAEGRPREDARTRADGATGVGQGAGLVPPPAGGGGTPRVRGRQIPPPPQQTVQQSNRTRHPGAPLTQPKHFRVHRGSE